ncbi:transmembrane protein 18-domain-containing protein [Gilbertella persicaria]|uniref:transmembrane protein 18-domain-containing protein n=1 Tax=Gilbertella persicaria TaxID=101096 RepID=UPI00221E5C60|nr:transmembrane protein 18-domain-containing protein [Gilbertella persicaria]KAI8094877.1 transmembrane protein 18-domain-containing protein [Gilbertella persicaria]
MSFLQDKNEILNNLLSSIQAELHNEAMLGSYTDQTVAFFKAVNWTQPWILGLLGCHMMCFLIAIHYRHCHDQLVIYFFSLLGLAALTQPLNQLGINYGNQFLDQAYFDPSGVFIVSVYSFPLIFNGFVTLIFILKAVVSIMIQTKRVQLKNKINKRN